MKYNTTVKRLSLPGYGRNIQNMVDYCITIEEREKRNQCANTIINIMGNLFPHLRDINGFRHILWDHLAIMSDFKLDVDYPYEIVKKESLYQRPPQIEYNNRKIKYLHYGQILERMIDKIVTLEEGPEKEALILSIANQMKKSYLLSNRDSVDDRKIFKDIAELSEGNIIRDETKFKLIEAGSIIDTMRQNRKSRKNYSRKS